MIFRTLITGAASVLVGIILFIAVLHYILGLWFLTAMFVFIAGALTYGAAWLDGVMWGKR